MSGEDIRDLGSPILFEASGLSKSEGSRPLIRRCKTSDNIFESIKQEIQTDNEILNAATNFNHLHTYMDFVFKNIISLINPHIPNLEDKDLLAGICKLIVCYNSIQKIKSQTTCEIKIACQTYHFYRKGVKHCVKIRSLWPQDLTLNQIANGCTSLGHAFEVVTASENTNMYVNLALTFYQKDHDQRKCLHCHKDKHIALCACNTKRIF
jgi:hypothetical protein